MSDERSILSRWSARKRAVEAESAAPPAPEAAAGAAEEIDAEARAAELEANRLAAEAIDLETLDKDSDMSVFLREGVPELLRKTALQKVWRSNPVFANLDELVDYGEDFGRKDLIMETFTSAWQAGRGYLKEVEDKAEASPDAPEQLAAADPAPTTPSDEDQAEAAPADEEPATTQTAPPEETADIPLQDATSAPAPPGPVRSARGSLRARLARDTDEV